jgi:sporulation protein YlmC with PRC-barrel domain
MLRSIESLKGCTVAATDGDIGSVEEVYFDDEAWGIRYLVVKTGSWIDERRVLISPYSVRHSDPGSASVHVELTRQQVSDSPPIDTHKPVSRQHEAEYLRYYGYPPYWGGVDVWGMSSYPAFSRAALSPVSEETRAQLALYGDKPPGDSHLRSTDAVDGYHVQAADGDIGHVSGFIFDDESWTLRYLTVDTQNWWPTGKEVLLATEWIFLIDWYESTVSTQLTRDAIKDSPAYDSNVPIGREFETGLYAFYGKPGYWSKDAAVVARPVPPGGVSPATL